MIHLRNAFCSCITCYTLYLYCHKRVYDIMTHNSHISRCNISESLNTCFNHKTSINASSNWIHIFKTKQEPKQSCSFKIWSRERAYTIQNSSNSVSLICSVQSEDCSLGLQWSVRSLQYLILRTFKIMDEFWWASFKWMSGHLKWASFGRVLIKDFRRRARKNGRVYNNSSVSMRVLMHGWRCSNGL